jgi:hypothetical protein
MAYLKPFRRRKLYVASPSALEREFNLRWYGRLISNQAAWGWRNNRPIPTQDKVQVLDEIHPGKISLEECMKPMGITAAR